MVTPPRAIQRLRDRQQFTIGEYQWQVIVGRGHSPEHACLYCPEAQLLISGDQVLPRISPHIGVYPTEPEANSLADYLHSLEVLTCVSDETLVMPSHGHVFYGLHRRLQGLQEHHQIRLDRLLNGLTKPLNVLESLPIMFTRPLRESDMGLASSECLAHLHYLMHKGQIRRELGTDGVYRLQVRNLGTDSGQSYRLRAIPFNEMANDGFIELWSTGYKRERYTTGSWQDGWN